VRSRRLGFVLLAAIVAFAVAFAVARAAAGGGSETAAAPAPRSYAPVAIDNLERMPEIKPLRSAAGAPPVPASGTTTTGAPVPSK
jgi:hypothetical protein